MLYETQVANWTVGLGGYTDGSEKERIGAKGAEEKFKKAAIVKYAGVLKGWKSKLTVEISLSHEQYESAIVLA